MAVIFSQTSWNTASLLPRLQGGIRAKRGGRAEGARQQPQAQHGAAQQAVAPGSRSARRSRHNSQLAVGCRALGSSPFLSSDIHNLDHHT